MKRLSLSLVFALAVCVFPVRSDAQAPYKDCIDTRGFNVVWIADNAARSLAEAGFASDDWPVIKYNPDILSSLHSQSRLFFQVHECAHHVLGHPIKEKLSLDQEITADCWALNTLVYSGKFAKADVSLVQAEIARLADGDWTHIPGPKRKIQLNRCLK